MPSEWTLNYAYFQWMTSNTKLQCQYQVFAETLQPGIIFVERVWLGACVGNGITYNQVITLLDGIW